MTMKLATTFTLLRVPRIRAKSVRSNRRRPYSAKTACVSGLTVLLLFHAAAGFFIVANLHSDHVYSYRNKLFAKRLEQVKGADTLNVVLMGSSRVQNGMSARVVESQVEENLKQQCVSVNFACSGAGPITQWLYLRRLLEDGRKVDFLIVEIYPLNMGLTQGGPAEVLWLDPQQVYPDEVSLLAGYGFDESLLRQSMAPNCQAMIRYWDRMRFRLLRQINSHLLPRNVVLQLDPTFEYRGWIPIVPKYAPPAGRMQRMAAQFQTIGVVERWQPAAGVDAALRDMLLECRKRGIHVVLTYTPEASEFRSRFSEAAMADIHQYLDSLQRDWQVPVVFAREWMPDSTFVDLHHLYHDAAEQFTERFCREYLLPYMAHCLAEGSAPKK